CVGLDLLLSTLFASLELGERDGRRELLDLLGSRSAREIEFATQMLRALFDEFDAIATEHQQERGVG
ncbi:MAG: hypothetical protein R6X02_10885, partial [Enhygromyxa sp.]